MLDSEIKRPEALKAHTSRNWKTGSVMPIFPLTAEWGMIKSGGGCGGDLNCFALPFLFISGEVFASWPFIFFHSFAHKCVGLAALMTMLLETYSSWPCVLNSSTSNFCSLSNCAFSCPVATT